MIKIKLASCNFWTAPLFYHFGFDFCLCGIQKIAAVITGQALKTRSCGCFGCFNFCGSNRRHNRLRVSIRSSEHFWFHNFFFFDSTGLTLITVTNASIFLRSLKWLSRNFCSVLSRWCSGNFVKLLLVAMPAPPGTVLPPLFCWLLTFPKLLYFSYGCCGTLYIFGQ